jgi:hypothetical protein
MKFEIEDGMRICSRVKVNETSGYVTTVVFMDWHKNLNIPRKETRNVPFIFEGHVNVIDFARENDITLSTQRYKALYTVSRLVVPNLFSLACLLASYYHKSNPPY